MSLSIIFIIFSIVLVLSALISFFLRDLLASIISFSVFGLVMTALFYLLDAPDVAIAEAAIGAALTVCIFVIAIRMTRRREE
jgi:energy-converting hydrogenase B subunit D